MELNINHSDLTSTTAKYLNPGRTCWLTGANSVVNTQVTTTDCVITLSDGTTTIGTITIAAGSAAGVVDSMVLDATSLGKVELSANTPLKIASDGACAAGAAEITLTFSAFHGGTT